MIGRVPRFLLHRFLKHRRRRLNRSPSVISPSQRVGRIRQPRHIPARCLRQAQRHVEIAAVLQHQISKIVRRRPKIRSQAQSPPIRSLRLLPISSRLVSPAQRRLQLSASRRERRRLPITLNRLRALPLRSLHLRQRNDSIDILPIDRHRSFKRSLRVGRLPCLHLTLPQQHERRNVARILVGVALARSAPLPPVALDRSPATQVREPPPSNSNRAPVPDDKNLPPRPIASGACAIRRASRIPAHPAARFSRTAADTPPPQQHALD